MERNNFIGLNGFIWWMGKIVNVQDPLGLGRCQVRIFGWHTDNKSLLPDSDLPWAMAMYPINNANSFALPNGPTILSYDANNNPVYGEDGDWVVGFFMDGESGQFPIMMGIVPGLKGEKL